MTKIGKKIKLTKKFTKKLSCTYILNSTCAMLIILSTSGCTDFDPLNQNVITMNKSAADYANSAILINIVRAKLYEPLTFATITGISGIDSVGAGVGIPTIPFGPHAHTAPHSFSLGPNSLTRSNQTTFQVSIVDDPGSFAALLAPVNPAIMAFFMREGYSRELVFFLFTDKLVETDKITGEVTHVYFNSPSLNRGEWGDDFIKFKREMGTLLTDGLMAEIDISSVPTGRALPPSKLCTDPSRARRPNLGYTLNSEVMADAVKKKDDVAANRDRLNAAGATLQSQSSRAKIKGSKTASDTNIAAILKNNIQKAQNQAAMDQLDIIASGHIPKSIPGACDQVGWVEAVAAGSGSGGQSGATNVVATTQDGSLWLAQGSQVFWIPKGSDPATYKPDPIKLPDPKATSNGSSEAFASAVSKNISKVSQYSTSYEFDALERHYELYTRSTFGAYDYLGQLLVAKEQGKIDGIIDDNGSLVDIDEKANINDCFADADYKLTRYCVPNDQKANNTKQIFKLLHQLQELNTAPSNTPTTLTVVGG